MRQSYRFSIRDVVRMVAKRLAVEGEFVYEFRVARDIRDQDDQSYMTITFESVAPPQPVIPDDPRREA